MLRTASSVHQFSTHGAPPPPGMLAPGDALVTHTRSIHAASMHRFDYSGGVGGGGGGVSPQQQHPQLGGGGGGAMGTPARAYMAQPHGDAGGGHSFLRSSSPTGAAALFRACACVCAHARGMRHALPCRSPPAAR
jgi:hypothetical protein